MRLASYFNGNVFLGPTQNHDKGWTQTERFAHAVVQHLHLVQVVKFDVPRYVFQYHLLLVADAVNPLGIIGDKKTGPGTGDAARVLASKQQGNKQSSDFFGGNLGPVLVGDIAKELKDICSVGSRRVLLAFPNNRKARTLPE